MCEREFRTVTSRINKGYRLCEKCRRTAGSEEFNHYTFLTARYTMVGGRWGEWDDRLVEG